MRPDCGPVQAQNAPKVKTKPRTKKEKPINKKRPGEGVPHLSQILACSLLK